MRRKDEARRGVCVEEEGKRAEDEEVRRSEGEMRERKKREGEARGLLVHQWFLETLQRVSVS